MNWCSFERSMMASEVATVAEGCDFAFYVDPERGPVTFDLIAEHPDMNPDPLESR